MDFKACHVGAPRERNASMKSLHFFVLPAILLGGGACAANIAATAPPAGAQHALQPADAPATFSGQAGAAPIADPWERFNRGMYSFNGKIDKYIARPIGVAYDTVVPTVVQRRVTSFFANLREPRTLVNQLLQGEPVGAASTLGRFVVNTTAGIGGIFDPASALALKPANEDFGQTLAVWGWEDSRYFVAPLQGPSTLRDFGASFGDKPLNPLGYVDDAGASAALTVVNLGSVRSGAFALDAMRATALDEYAMVRDMWAQRRKQQIAKR